ncbi:MAG: AAA family ATPase [Myxococcales bacterium]|nr:AAA family ATPase [Myxococcales bacterium]
MQRLVIFGKGGIGKSTLATGLSASLAAAGHRVLHVGCDPKHDSTAALLGGRMIEPVIDRIERVKGVTAEDIVTRSHLGVDCVEAGGPGAGVGCGGRGITRMLEIFREAQLLPGGYDVTLYDVLGDVVCGGFAAPLRKGVGEKVIIVASEELMALYAANNIAKAVVHYATNEIALAGIVFNLKHNETDRAPLRRFASLINARVLGYVPRDPLVREAEYRRKTVVEHAPASSIARRFAELARHILELDVRGQPLPTPLSEQEFYELARQRFARADERAPAPTPAPASDDATVDATRLLARVHARAEARRSSYLEELSAGTRAVRLGLVTAEEAARRLRAGYPTEARALRAEELLA